MVALHELRFIEKPSLRFMVMLTDSGIPVRSPAEVSPVVPVLNDVVKRNRTLSEKVGSISHLLLCLVL